MVAQLLRLKTPPAPEDAAVALTHLMIATRQAALFRRAATTR